MYPTDITVFAFYDSNVMNKSISGLVFPHLDKALLDFFFGEVGFHLHLNTSKIVTSRMPGVLFNPTIN